MSDYLELCELMCRVSDEARKEFFKTLGLEPKSALGWDIWECLIESKEERPFLSEKEWAAVKCDWRRYNHLLDEEDYKNEIDSHA